VIMGRQMRKRRPGEGTEVGHYRKDARTVAAYMKQASEHLLVCLVWIVSNDRVCVYAYMHVFTYIPLTNSRLDAFLGDMVR
jgi:hypothetical protein